MPRGGLKPTVFYGLARHEKGLAGPCLGRWCGPWAGIARHDVEVGLYLLTHASMPMKFWDDAFLAATYLINRTPSCVIDYLTPLEKLFGEKSNYSSFWVFGYACWPNLRPFNQRKL